MPAPRLLWGEFAALVFDQRSHRRSFRDSHLIKLPARVTAVGAADCVGVPWGRPVRRGMRNIRNGRNIRFRFCSACFFRFASNRKDRDRKSPAVPPFPAICGQRLRETDIRPPALPVIAGEHATPNAAVPGRPHRTSTQNPRHSNLHSPRGKDLHQPRASWFGSRCAQSDQFGGGIRPITRGGILSGATTIISPGARR